MAETGYCRARSAPVRDRVSSRRRTSSGRASILFSASMIGRPAPSSITPRSCSTASTSARCCSLSGWAMSRTCTIRSASSTSSSVARKAATRCVGRSEMKPTVSEITHGLPLGSLIDRMVGSSVANSRSLAITAAPRQPIEQRRLAGVGVADQRHRRQARLAAAGAVDGARAAHAFEVALDAHDALADQAAVDLDLRFAGAAEEAEAAALAFQVGPRPHQAAALVVERGQLDLQAAFMRAGARAEDLQDQPGAVDDLGLQRLLEIALLHRRQPVVDDDQPDPLLLDIGLHALDHALADQRGGRDAAQRHGLGQAHIEVDGAGKPDRLSELGVAITLLTVHTRRIRRQHGRDRPRPGGVLGLALAPLVSVQLVVFAQINPLRRPCRRRTAAPA